MFAYDVIIIKNNFLKRRDFKILERRNNEEENKPMNKDRG